jgi:hypothetical protein
MPATAKSRRQASVATKSARKSTAKKPADKPAKQSRETVVEAHASRNEQGRIIQELMSKSPMTVAQLVERTGYTESRVQAHVDYEASRGRSRLNGKKQVVVLAQPVRRNAG